jgi:integrase
MPLKLIPPGKRRGNRFYIARGRIFGKLYEYSTETTDKALAERRAHDLAADIIEGGPPPPPEAAVTFKTAAEAYTAYRKPGWDEVRRINRLIAELGTRDITSITHADLVATASTLYPRHLASSLNRLVITPASAILHYAASNGWCSYLKIKRFKEAAPETRALRQTAAQKLIAAADGVPLAFLVFLFGQGLRVSDAIKLEWENLDLRQGLMRVRVAKTDRWRWKALHPDARAALAGLPAKPAERTGRVFPYANRWAAYRALKPAIAESGVKFTPHMARHSVGTWLGSNGVSLKTIMDILDHQDPKSSMRYQMTELPEQRAAFAAVGKFVGKAKKPKESA